MRRHQASGDSAAGLLALVVLGIGVVLGTYSMHLLYFVVLALVPAATAALIEPPGQRAATIAIASLTMATILPLVLGTMMVQIHRDLLTSTAAWSYVGGAVLAGLAIFLCLPAGTAWREDRRAKRRIQGLRKRQQQIEEEWGPEVRTTVAH
jgi:hypothetical protein